MTDEHVYKPWVDLRYSEYGSCFTSAQTEAIFDACDGKPGLEQIGNNLVVNWRAASDAGGTAAEILNNASAAPELYLYGNFPDEDLQDLTEGALKLLANDVSEISLNPELAARVRKAVLKNHRKMLATRQRLPKRFPKDEIWRILLEGNQGMRFVLRLHDSQRLCYMTLYNTYETFLVECVKTAARVDQLRASTQEFKQLFREHFGQHLIDECWFHDEVKIARVVRHSLSHAGGRITKDISELKEKLKNNNKAKFEIRDLEDVLQIWPEDNLRLMQIVFERAMEIIAKASTLDQFLMPLPQIGAPATASDSAD